MDDKKKVSFIFRKKALFGIAPAIAIIAIFLSKHKAPEVLLFIIGIFSGIIIGINWKKKAKVNHFGILLPEIYPN